MPIVLHAGGVQELQFINHHKLPVKILLLNNDGYHAISSMQAKHTYMDLSRGWNYVGGTRVVKWRWSLMGGHYLLHVGKYTLG